MVPLLTLRYINVIKRNLLAAVMRKPEADLASALRCLADDECRTPLVFSQYRLRFGLGGAVMHMSNESLLVILLVGLGGFKTN